MVHLPICAPGRPAAGVVGGLSAMAGGLPGSQWVRVQAQAATFAELLAELQMRMERAAPAADSARLASTCNMNADRPALLAQTGEPG